MPTQLEEEHDQILEFIYASPIGLAQMDADGTMAMVNPRAMQLLMPLGAAANGMNLFRTLRAFAPDLPSLVNDFAAPRGQVCHARRIFVGRSIPHPEGLPQVLACTIVKLDDHRYMATLDDVSEQAEQERRLKQAEVWFASLIEQTEEFAVIGVDAEGRIESLNASAKRQTGLTEPEVVGQPITILDHPNPTSPSPDPHEGIALARRNGWHLSEAWCSNGEGIGFRCQRLICVRNESEMDGRQYVSGFTVVLRPASSGGVDTHVLRSRLTKDHLTGVCNRAHFFEVAEAERRRCHDASHDVGVITLDIDHFKRVNDTHGHAAGDSMLRAVARACADTLPLGDTFARLGGEEFVALVPNASAKDVVERAEAMRRAVSAVTVNLGGADLRATASFGCAMERAGKFSIHELLERADKALYQAKRNGRDRVEFTDAERSVA